MNQGDAHAIFAYLAQRKHEMISLLSALVSAESPSLAPETQGPVFALLAERLQALDYRAMLQGRRPGWVSGGLLLAQPRQRRRGAAFQLLIGHCDTVWPVGALATMPLTVQGDRMSGPGVFDMKGSLVQLIYALQAIRDLGLQPAVTPVVLVNSDEEIGSPDSAPQIRRLARCANRALILEPGHGPEGKLKTARKGVLRFDVSITGKAAHAGAAPEQGASAILELSYVIQKLFGLNDPARGVTVNVGVVQGGLRPNVVAPESRAEVDVRVLTQEDAKRVAGAILSLQATTPGTRLEVRQGHGVAPLEFSERNRRLWELAHEAGRGLGLELDHCLVGGASDGNTTSQFTATLDGLGVLGDGAHASHEFVYLDKLAERGALLALLIMAPPLPQ